MNRYARTLTFFVYEPRGIDLLSLILIVDLRIGSAPPVKTPYMYKNSNRAGAVTWIPHLLSHGPTVVLRYCPAATRGLRSDLVHFPGPILYSLLFAAFSVLLCVVGARAVWPIH